MKKFLFLIFLLTYSFNSSAHMAHYNKFNKIEMEILRDGEVIGYNYFISYLTLVQLIYLFYFVESLN